MIFGVDLSYLAGVVSVAYIILVAIVLLYFAVLGTRQETDVPQPDSDQSESTAESNA